MTRVRPAKKSFSIDVNRIGCGFHHDSTAARSNVKAKKNPLSLLDREPLLVKIVMSDTSLVGSGEISLKGVLAFLRGSI